MPILGMLPAPGYSTAAFRRSHIKDRPTRRAKTNLWRATCRQFTQDKAVVILVEKLEVIFA